MAFENTQELKDMLDGIKKLKVVIKERKAELKIQESILKESEERFVLMVSDELDKENDGLFATTTKPQDLVCFDSQGRN